jgi:hypothetical protein
MSLSAASNDPVSIMKPHSFHRGLAPPRASSKLFRKSKLSRWRPINTILPASGSSESCCCEGLSKMSKISRTPWMILSLPTSLKKRPFRRWMSYAGPSVGLWPGSTFSHRTDRSQASSAACWFLVNLGSGIDMVEIVCPSQR